MNENEFSFFNSLQQNILNLCQEPTLDNTVSRMWGKMLVPAFQTKFNWTGLHSKNKLKDSELMKLVYDTTQILFPQLKNILLKG